jgi:hypothetical protein
MKRLGWLVLAILCWATPVSAQPDVDARRLYLGTTGATQTLRAGAGSPEGAVTAVVGVNYLNVTDGKWWRKATGSGNTGWVETAGVSGSGTANQVAFWNGSTSLTGSALFTVNGTALVSVLGTTAQFQTGYDASNYLIWTVGSTGAVTLSRAQSVVNNFAVNIAAGQFRVLTNTGGDTLPALGVSGGSFALLTSGGLFGMLAGIDGGTGNTWLQAQRVDGTPTAYNIELQPTSGNVILGGSATGHLLPATTYNSDIGSDAKKIRTLYAAELTVQTLVAQEQIGVIGGAVTIAPTTELTADLASGGTTITLKHNNFTNGDRIVLKKAGQVEWMAIASGAGGSAGLYTYTVTRNLDASGANNWTIGDAAMNTGTTGDGFIDLASGAGLIPGSTVGPTIAFNVRTGTTWSDIATRAALGNLNGLYGYAVDTYGAAFGDASNAWVKIDPTNGVRIGHNATTKVQIDASGNASFAGAITATSGTIGSFTIGTYLYSGSKTAWNDTNAGVHIGSDGIGIGNNVFTVNGSTGAMVATSATISGDITATSGSIGGCTIAGTSITCGSGFSVSNVGVIAATSGAIGGCALASGSITCGSGDDVVIISATDGTYRACFGNASCASSPTTVDKDGYFRTESATFGSGSAGVDVGSSGLTVNGTGSIVAGSGDVVIDNDGITITGGGSGQNKINFTDGTFITSNAGLFGGFIIDSASAISLTGSGLFASSASSTTDNDDPVVRSGASQLRYKTNGFDGSGGCAGTGVENITAESGILMSVDCLAPGNSNAELRAEIEQLKALIAMLLPADRKFR